MELVKPVTDYIDDCDESKLFVIRGCIQKLPDWVDNEINNKNKHSLWNNTKGYGGKTR